MFEAIRDGFVYPFNDKNWSNKFLYSMVWFIPFFGFFLLVGYHVKALRENIGAPKQELPEWDDWIQLFIDGVKGTIITFFYILIPLVIFSLSFLPYLIGIIGISVTNNEMLQLISIFGGYFASLLLMICSGIILFFTCACTPMALALYAAKGSILSGINVIGVIRNILSNFIYYSLIIIAHVLINSVFAVIVNIPIIGPLIGIIIMPPYLFYVNAFYGKTLGDMFRTKGIV